VMETLGRLPSVHLWCVMVQREVADRFFAAPGTKAYGAVSVLVQLAAERTGFHPVSRTVFRPQPNVDSALVAFRRKQRPESWDDVKRVVEGAFAHRRKTLPNSLQLSGLADRERAAAALAGLGRPAQARAEALAPEEFVALADAL
jgi:16S rRNA (adenine1518-N6/adenine1519-N6)-dimethyltransferase